MNILAVGDRIDFDFEITGIHSKFANAINFYTDKGMIFVVSKKVGAGPNSIVFDVEKFDDFDKERLFDLNYVKGFVIYDSTFKPLHKNIDIILENLGYIKEYLLKYSSPLSASFILDETRKFFFKGGFNGALIEKLEKYFNRLLEFDFESIDFLKGLGYGLTPQGDDLIEGFLASLYVYEKLFSLNFLEAREVIYRKAQTDNEISNTFLFYTSRGYFYERFKNVLNSVFTGVNIEDSVIRMLSFGETSGADILTGFVKGFEKLLEGGNKLWQ